MQAAWRGYRLLRGAHPLFQTSFIQLRDLLLRAFAEAATFAPGLATAADLNTHRNAPAQPDSSGAADAAPALATLVSHGIGVRGDVFWQACARHWCLALGRLHGGILAAVISACLEEAGNLAPTRAPEALLRVLLHAPPALRCACFDARDRAPGDAQARATPRAEDPHGAPVPDPAATARYEAGIAEDVVWRADSDASGDEDETTPPRPRALAEEPVLVAADSGAAVDASARTDEPASDKDVAGMWRHVIGTGAAALDDMVLEALADIEALDARASGLAESARRRPEDWLRVAQSREPWEALPAPFAAMPRFLRFLIALVVAPHRLRSALRWFANTDGALANSGLSGSSPSAALRAALSSDSPLLLLHAPATDALDARAFVNCMAAMAALGTASLLEQGPACTVSAALAAVAPRPLALPQPEVLHCGAVDGAGVVAAVVNAARAGAWILLLDAHLSAAHLPAALQQLDELEDAPAKRKPGFRLIGFCPTNCVGAFESVIPRSALIRARASESARGRAFEIAHIAAIASDSGDQGSRDSSRAVATSQAIAEACTACEGSAGEALVCARGHFGCPADVAHAWRTLDLTAAVAAARRTAEPPGVAVRRIAATLLQVYERRLALACTGKSRRPPPRANDASRAPRRPPPHPLLARAAHADALQQPLHTSGDSRSRSPRAGDRPSSGSRAAPAGCSGGRAG